jgi:PQQ-dependent catabolism-associated CXXCW motif protein
MRILALALILFAAPAWAEGYRTHDYRAPTPLSLDGATTLDTDEAKALMDRGGIVPIDVLPAPRRADGTWLLPKPRKSLPGAVWLANAGYGDLSPQMQAWFKAQLKLVSGGEKARPLMFYCVIDCWMSWNAAKRAMALGYTRVYWYPEGTDGWEFNDLPLVEVWPRGP